METFVLAVKFIKNLEYHNTEHYKFLTTQDQGMGGVY